MDSSAALACSPCPRSPPVCPDFSGRRSEIVKIHLLEREINLLQGELRLIQGFQVPSSTCCKEVVESVDAKSDPFVPIKSPCLILSWIGKVCCCSPCVKISSCCCCRGCPIPSCAISDCLPSCSPCTRFFPCSKCRVPTLPTPSSMFKCNSKCECPCNCSCCASVFACCKSILCCSFLKCNCNPIKFNFSCCWCLSF